MNCPYCGSACTPIEGQTFTDSEGYRCQEVSCDQGHRFGVRLGSNRSCPACGHHWQEGSRGGGDDVTPAPSHVQGFDLDGLAGQAGLGGVVRYE
jgi:hypothetical protein